MQIVSSTLPFYNFIIGKNQEASSPLPTITTDKNMSSHNFKFKQFTVWHDQCAMKVGTDGVLLGSWCCVENAAHVLDIGTGSGLISLMIAQRNTTSIITAIDIDECAVNQANNNFENSPFKGRITALHISLNDFVERQASSGQEHLFDLIVSNPPYYTANVLSPDSQRHVARHSSSLPFDQLVYGAARLLSSEGVLAIIIPYEVASNIIGLAAEHGLSLVRRCDIRNSERKSWKRSMLEFAKTNRSNNSATMTEQLTINRNEGGWSDSYRMLTSEFYLDK